MTSQVICNASADDILLPVEILAQIFRATCYIDARFYLTLRHVSRLCREIARPLKYCSIFIQGPEHLHFIVQQLTQYPANIPLIEHVALTDHNQSSRRDTPKDVYKMFQHRQFNRQMHHTARPDSYPSPNEMFARDLRVFFDLVAPTLRTLHIALYSSNLPIYFEVFRPTSARTYPQLEEIAFRGKSSMWSEVMTQWTVAGGDGIIPSRTGRTTFPQLRRLWLSGLGHYMNNTQQGYLSDLAMACPELTHLRLHEESTYTLQRVLDRFMHWHGVQLGETCQFISQAPELYEWERKHALDVVSVLQTNALLGFPNLQRLIIDLRLEGRPRRRSRGVNHSRSALFTVDRDIMYAVAKRRREVVLRWCCSCKRGRAALPFMRNLFERSVEGDKELWDPENELFQEEEAQEWQPIRVLLPDSEYSHRGPLTYRANIPMSSLEQESSGRHTGPDNSSQEIR